LSETTVSAAGAELLSAAEASSSTRSELRELRAALSHIDAELGPLPLRSLDDERVAAFVANLREAGISPQRERAIVRALGALRPGRPAVPVPVPASATPATPARPAPPANAPTPTDAMLALGTRVATLASVAIFLLFAGVIALAVVTLA
jgi:hypothetical protein